VPRILIWLTVLTLASGCAYLAKTENLPSPSPYDSFRGGPELGQPGNSGL
jgi:hypothetical protein